MNTSSTKVVLRWDIANSGAIDDDQRALLLDRLESRLTKDGVLVLTSSEYRSQTRNREAVLARFAAIVGEAMRPRRRRRATRPSRAVRERRLADKRRRAETKTLRKRPQT